MHQVTEQRFGRRVALPPVLRGDRARDAQLARMARAYAVPVDPADAREGDLSLMRPIGRRGAGHHIGLAARVGERLEVLHCAAGVGTVLTPLSALRLIALEHEGWWRWRDDAPADDARADVLTVDAAASASLAWWPHPLSDTGRTGGVLPAGTTLADVAARLGIDAIDAPAVMILNGRLVAPAEWAGTALAAGDAVEVRAALGKGGFLRTVLQLAIIAGSIYAPYGLAAAGVGGLVTGGAVAAGISGATTAAQLTILGHAVAAGTLIGGNLLLNAVVPPRGETAPRVDRPAREPSYSLSSGQNDARPWDPLMLVLGTMRVFPDLIGEPYSEYDENSDQSLSQLFDFGLSSGQLVVAPGSLRIGDTPLDADHYDLYTGTRRSIDWGFEGQGLSRHVHNVDEDVAQVSGGKIEWWKKSDGSIDYDRAGPGPWITRRTAAGVIDIAIDIVGSLMKVSSAGAGTIEAETVTLDWEVYAVDDNGNRATAPLARNTHVATWEHQRPYRRTVWLRTVPDGRTNPANPLPARGGRYDVRVRRQTAPADDDKRHSDLTWATLRAVQPEEAELSMRNWLGLRLRASGQAQGRLDRVSATVTHRVRRLNDAGDDAGAETAVTGAEASCAAWVFLAFARGRYDAGVTVAGKAQQQRLVWGCGLPDERIDLDAIRSWGRFCWPAAGTKLRCDMIVRPGASCQEVLDTIARCGRATVDWSTGKLGVIWDSPGRPVSALITPATIVAGSFRSDWLGERLPGEYIGRYLDRDRDWERTEVRRRVSDTGEIGAVATIDLEGVTTRQQALEEISLEAAGVKYHPVRRSWSMPVGALAAPRGAVVAVTHSLVDGGQTGRLKAIWRERSTTGTYSVGIGTDGDGGRLLWYSGRPTIDLTTAVEIPAGWMFDRAATTADRQIQRIRYRADRTPKILNVLIGEIPQYGPAENLKSAYSAGVIFRFTRGDGAVLDIPGPTAPGSRVSDSAEPYTWAPAIPETELDDFFLGAARGETMSLVLIGLDLHEVTLSEPVDLGTADDRLMLTLPNGSLHLTAVTRGEGEADDDDVTRLALTKPLPSAALAAMEGASPLDWAWRFYGGAGPPKAMRIIALRRGGDRTIRVDAIDEDPLYYAAATLAETEALPPRGLRKAPVVLGAVVTEETVPAGTGYAVEITVEVAVAGDWRGGAVYARLGTGRRRHVASMVDGGTEASWLAIAVTGTLRIEIVPGAAGAPVGAPFGLDHVLGSGRSERAASAVLGPPVAVTGFRVSKGLGGTRLFTWDRHPRDDVTAYSIRFYDGRLYHEIGRPNGPPWSSETPARTGRTYFDIRPIAADGTLGAPSGFFFTLPAVQEGVDGAPGADGEGIETIYSLTERGRTDPGASKRPLNSWPYKDGYPRSVGGQRWYDQPVSPTDAHPVQIWSQRTITGNPTPGTPKQRGWGNWSIPTALSSLGIPATVQAVMLFNPATPRATLGIITCDLGNPANYRTLMIARTGAPQIIVRMPAISTSGGIVIGSFRQSVPRSDPVSGYYRLRRTGSRQFTIVVDSTGLNTPRTGTFAPIESLIALINV